MFEKVVYLPFLGLLCQEHVLEEKINLVNG